MHRHMPDSRLNEPERGLQHSFRKSPVFNGLMMGFLLACGVLALYLPIRALPDRHQLPPRQVELHFQPVRLPAATGPLRVAGAWVMTADDRRLAGLSALAIDDGRFLALSDLGAAIRFDPPSKSRPRAMVADLLDGPGPTGKKTSRDAELVALDPRGRGWWVGFEQRHSIWLYDRQFKMAEAAIPILRNWPDNRGIEGLIADGDGLLALAENGREAIRVDADGLHVMGLDTASEVADAARAPDGGAWLLLRTQGRDGIGQAIAPLIHSGGEYRIGDALPLPKAAFDNFEGMAIAPRPGGGWRFWLVTDDGHRFKARTLLVALDLERTQKNARR